MVLDTVVETATRLCGADGGSITIREGEVYRYVSGAIAGSYHFTSALTVQLLKSIQPQLEPLLSSPPTGAAPAPITTALPAAT